MDSQSLGIGEKVVCNSEGSGGGSSAWGSLTGVPAGFSDGIDNVLDETTVDSYANNNGYLKLDGSGRIGIGTSVTILNTKLNIDTGNIVLSDTYGLGWGGNETTVPTCGIKGSATDNYLAIKTNNLERIRVDSSGNVGIGTSTPNEKLSVNGALSIAELDVSPDSTSGFGKLYSKLISVNYYTTLLMHADGINNTFIDSSIFNRDISVSGQTTHSTTQSKFGGKSAYFSGSNDWVSIPASSDFNFGTDPFAIDFWFYRERSNVQETLLNSWSDWYALDNWST